MKNKEIVTVLKKDIKELKKQGYDNLSFSCGSLFNKYKVILMVNISNNDGGGIGCCFSKSHREIQYETKGGALKLIELLKTKIPNIKIHNGLNICK